MATQAIQSTFTAAEAPLGNNILLNLAMMDCFLGGIIISKNLKSNLTDCIPSFTHRRQTWTIYMSMGVIEQFMLNESVYIYANIDRYTTAMILLHNQNWGQNHHYSDVIMSMMVFQIIGVSIVYSTVCSGADQRKHQSCVSLAFGRGSPPVMWKIFLFDDVIMIKTGISSGCHFCLHKISSRLGLFST